MESLKKGHIEAGKDMLSIYCYNNPKTKIFSGKGLMLGGSQINNNGRIEGDLSAILLDNFPFWVNMHRTPDIETALLARWEEKLDRIVDQAIKENVTNLTGATSWMLIVLNMVLEKTKAKDILEVWPNLELYMHGGMNFLPYKNQFQKLIPNPNMNYMECYNASEGFFAIQDQASADEMLLMFADVPTLARRRRGAVRWTTWIARRRRKGKASEAAASTAVTQVSGHTEVNI